jgi:hypothetical protein
LLSAGDGRELFNLQPNGQLLSVAGKLCAGIAGDETLALEKCDASKSASRFEIQGSAQLKMTTESEMCLSQKGVAAGSADAALFSAATASSTIDALSHGAAMAVDGHSSSYWASSFISPGEVVEFALEFGGLTKLQMLDILWEFAAEQFSVSVTTDGIHWSEVYTSSVNILNHTRVLLGDTTAAKAKIEMVKPQPAAQVQGRTLYGIRSLSFTTGSLRTVVEDCTSAAETKDARDKYFLNAVGEQGPCPAKALREELPALEAAKSSLAAISIELAEAMSRTSPCDAGVSLVEDRAPRRVGPVAFARARREGSSANAAVGDFDLEAAYAIQGVARGLVLQARAAVA